MATLVKAGRYEISGELGRGAMGVVFRATDPVIGRNVAVKTIRLSEEGTGLTRSELLARFQTEARAAGLLTHPNIVVVYDAGEENGLFFITMELVEGKSMQALLDEGHLFPVPRLLRIIEQTCSALQFAHDRNVVHRDIKPANLMLTADDTVKVTDFGTAKILQFGTVQQTTHVMGTPSYMSPEQVKGRPVDGRSDIFSLGVMFYEMLTGEKPFPGQSVTTVIYKIVNEDPIPPRQLNTSIHPGLNDIVMRALQKEPEMRYQSCREMTEDLKNYRALGTVGNNPEATLVSSRTAIANAIGPAGGGLRGMRGEDPAATPALRSLQNRGGNPTQTPTLRRTGTLQPYQEPKKKNVLGTVLAALLLLGVIAFGAYKLRPELEAARARNSGADAGTIPPASDAPVPSSKTAEPATPETSVAAPANNPPASENSTPPATDTPETKSEAALVMPSAKLGPDAGLTPAALAYKRQIGVVIAQRGLALRVQLQGHGDTLTIQGKLRPSEHAALLHFMRNAPTSVHIVDDILYDDTPVANGEGAGNESHPVPSKGFGAIHIVTDVLGATATLYGKTGSVVTNCTTPCSFNDLAASHYSLQVQKDGYQTVQTALELRAGESPDQKIHLEAIARGLLITTSPAGADVFINGAKQSGQTPLTLPLAAGQFNLVLRLDGYVPYVGQAQVKDNAQSRLNVEFKPRSQPHVAWAQVTTTPEGAEIFVDGSNTGEFSPARVQVSAGSHMLLLKKAGFQQSRRAVDVSEGGTVTVTEALKPKAAN